MTDHAGLVDLQQRLMFIFRFSHFSFLSFAANHKFCSVSFTLTMLFVNYELHKLSPESVSVHYSSPLQTPQCLSAAGMSSSGIFPPSARVLKLLSAAKKQNCAVDWYYTHTHTHTHTVEININNKQTGSQEL